MQNLLKLKDAGTPVAAITAYDATFAKLVQEAGVDTILVGDSLGMVIQGKQHTRSVSVADIAYHLRCVTQGAPNTHVMADLPFGSFEKSPEQAFASAARLVAAGADMVKVEGGASMAPTISFLVDRGIPVCGHVGLLPQAALFTGWRLQGKDEESAKRIANDAKSVCEAGASMLVLEMIPSSLAAQITQSVPGATIGIGAGVDCDGQILVLHDVIGAYGKPPSFAKDFLAGNDSIKAALAAYVSAVKDRKFPEAANIPA